MSIGFGTPISLTFMIQKYSKICKLNAGKVQREKLLILLGGACDCMLLLRRT